MELILRFWKELSIVVLLGVIWFMKLNPSTKTVVENYTHVITVKEVVEVERKVDVVKWKTKDRVIVKEKPSGERITITENTNAGETSKTNEQIKVQREVKEVVNKVTETKGTIQKYGIGMVYNFRSPLPYSVVVSYRPVADLPVEVLATASFDNEIVNRQQFGLGVSIKF